MSAPDELEILLAEVRKTINENSLFLKKLGDESDMEEEKEDVASDLDEENFEEL